MKKVRVEVILLVDDDAADDEQLLAEIVSDQLVEIGPVVRVDKFMVLGSEVEKILVLSTAHLPSPTDEESEWYIGELDDYEFDYGYRVPTFDEELWLSRAAPPWFLAVVAAAEEVDASYIIFDRDGGTVDYLEQWEW